MLIRQQLVVGSTKVNAGANPTNYLTIHETANLGVGADAAAHARLQSQGNVRMASWHWQVDDTEAVQSFPHTARCWHAGDGDGPGNNSSVAIEICVNADGDFRATVENAAALARKIMAQEGIPLASVVQHNHWSGKNCPTFLRSGSRGVSWVDFLAMIKDSTDESAVPELDTMEVDEMSMERAIEGYYEKFLGRRAGRGDVNDWMSAWVDIGPKGVRDGIRNSEEAKAFAALPVDAQAARRAKAQVIPPPAPITVVVEGGAVSADALLDRLKERL